MGSVPLNCNICPKEPEFSDISHLLTHVASKGHLSQYFKAQVRSRQDTSIRKKLEAYDRWYEKHQIEKLLSQRMLLKESKDTGSRPKRAHDGHSLSTNPAKETKPRGKRRTSGKQSEQLSPFKIEDSIDPQLSWSPPSISPSPFINQLQHDDHFRHEPAYKHRLHIPRMCDVQQDASHCLRATSEPSPSPSKGISHLTQCHSFDTDSEHDYFQNFLRSPSRTTYPDPSELQGLPLGFTFRSSSIAKDGGDQACKTLTPNRDSLDEAEHIQSPVLKGVRWPGMSIFDSASLDAQRRRNQKKDGSILEQMEYNSSVVEQMERIYWPDGALKKKRVITGNVESSPIKEPTPPPKRQRIKTVKKALKEISTNAPKASRRKRKASEAEPLTKASELRNISEQALATLDPLPKLVYPKSTHLSYDPANEEERERHMSRGNSRKGRRQAFGVFNDNPSINEQPSAHLYGNTPTTGGRSLKHDTSTRTSHSHSHSHAPGVTTRRDPFISIRPPTSPSSRRQSHGLPLGPQSRSYTYKSRPFAADEDRENIEPLLDQDGRIDDASFQVGNHRVTQRYFSLTGNQPPQFFSSMPPQMDFGGLAEPNYYGSTFNPLNPHIPQHGLSPYYPHTLLPTPTFSAATRDDDHVKKDRSASSKPN